MAMFKSTVVRGLASLLVVSILFQGCATTGAEMRAKAREEYQVPPETTDLALQADLDRCNKEAEDAAQGLAIASYVLSGAGVIVWPLLVVGLGVGISAGVKQNFTKKACMSQAGYLFQKDAVFTPVTPPSTLQSEAGQESK